MIHSQAFTYIIKKKKRGKKTHKTLHHSKRIQNWESLTFKKLGNGRFELAHAAIILSPYGITLYAEIKQNAGGGVGSIGSSLKTVYLQVQFILPRKVQIGQKKSIFCLMIISPRNIMSTLSVLSFPYCKLGPQNALKSSRRRLNKHKMPGQTSPAPSKALVDVQHMLFPDKQEVVHLFGMAEHTHSFPLPPLLQGTGKSRRKPHSRGL